MTDGSSNDRARRILVVEDDEALRELLRESLEREGFSCDTVATGGEAHDALSIGTFDLVLLDLGLPDVRGLELLERVTDGWDVPVIIVSGRHGSEDDRVRGLRLGADDYLVKPFGVSELLARVDAVLRRTGVARDLPRLAFGDALVIDTVTREVWVDGEAVDLRAKEFDLLAHMAARPREVLSRRDLLWAVWRSKPEWQDPATVTEHVRRLRRKIERDGALREVLVAVRGVGYRFEPPAAAA